jgi:hypothetical protein
MASPGENVASETPRGRPPTDRRSSGIGLDNLALHLVILSRMLADGSQLNFDQHATHDLAVFADALAADQSFIDLGHGE